MTTTEYKDIDTNTHLELKYSIKIKIKRGGKHSNKTLTKTDFLFEKSHIRPQTAGSGSGIFSSKEVNLFLQDLEITEMRPTLVLPPIIQPYDKNIKSNININMNKQMKEVIIQCEEPTTKI